MLAGGFVEWSFIISVNGSKCYDESLVRIMYTDENSHAVDLNYTGFCETRMYFFSLSL